MFSLDCSPEGHPDLLSVILALSTMLHVRQRRVRLPTLFRDFPVMVGLTFVLSSPRPHQVCIRKGRHDAARTSKPVFTAVRDIGFEARTSQEKNLTIKDIYGQEVVDAFFKTEATCAVVLLSQSSQLQIPRAM